MPCAYGNKNITLKHDLQSNLKLFRLTKNISEMTHWRKIHLFSKGYDYIIRVFLPSKYLNCNILHNMIRIISSLSFSLAVIKWSILALQFLARWTSSVYMNMISTHLDKKIAYIILLNKLVAFTLFQM